MKKNDKIKVHMYSFGGEIETRNFDKVFAVYEKGGKLGIDWAENKFFPFEAFSNTVIFEKIGTGEKFHFSNIKKGIEKIA